MEAVVVRNLSKVYGKEKIQAVDDVSFSVSKGELFGLIGPDGAGKTSIFRMLTTLLLPDAGSATVDGFDIVKDYKKIRNTVGYMPGKFSLYQDLTIEENLNFFATVFGTSIEENYHLIKDIYVQIERFKDRRAGKLSGGMKQKLALCCALIHKPSVLFLDEPTTGVDPVSRKEFWEMLKRLKARVLPSWFLRLTWMKLPCAIASHLFRLEKFCRLTHRIKLSNLILMSCMPSRLITCMPC